MQIGVSTHPARRWSLLALVALLGLAVTFATTSASGASSGHAVAAKKKHGCKKKKGKKSAAAAKKKCKHKKTPAPTSPVLTPPKGPIERIRITWTGGADVDVHAWSNGLHDGWNETLGTEGAYELQIPGTTFHHSETGGDNENIVETNPNPSVPMTFGICNYPNALVDDADVTVKWVLADGTTKTDAGTLVWDDFLVEVDEQAGPADPVEDWCPQVA
jgi:hypothetical protein